MRNTYLVVEKRFYNENGHDYAFPVSYADIWAFSNRESAMKHARRLIQLRGTAYTVNNPTFKAGGCEALAEFVEKSYNANGVRYAVTVERQEVRR